MCLALRITYDSFSLNTDKTAIVSQQGSGWFYGIGYLFLYVRLQAWKKNVWRHSVCVSQGTSTGPNCSGLQLASVTICQNPHFHWFASPCGRHKCILSDSTVIPNCLDTLTKDLTLQRLCSVWSVFEKAMLTCMWRPSQCLILQRLHLDQYDIITIVNLGLCGTHTHSAETEALTGSQCLSLKVENLDWGISSLCNIFMKYSGSSSLAQTAALWSATLPSALNDQRWEWLYKSFQSYPLIANRCIKKELNTKLRMLFVLCWLAIFHNTKY